MDRRTKSISDSIIIEKFKGWELLEEKSRTAKITEVHEQLHSHHVSSFVKAVMHEENVNKDFIAQLIASYDSKKKQAKVEGRMVGVSEEALADALDLRILILPAGVEVENKDTWPAVDLRLSKDYVRFLHIFVSTFMYLNPCVMSDLKKKEIHELRHIARSGHPELFDIRRFMWILVESEILLGTNIRSCFYARHLQALIRNQHPDLDFDAQKKEGDGKGKEAPIDLTNDDDDDIMYHAE